MESVFVRGASADDFPSAMAPAEIADEVRAGRMNGDSEISKSLDTGFFPLQNAFRLDPMLREDFATALKLPRISRYRKLRPFLFFGIIPWLMLFELDREIAADDIGGATARMCLDILLVLTCASDLVRRVPRHPRVTAIVFLASAARFSLLLSRACFQDAHPLIYAAPILAFVAAIMTAFFSPTREQLVNEILAALAIDPKPKEKIARPKGSLTFAFLIAALLPVALLTSARYTGIWGEALVMVAWGFALPQRAAPNVDNFAPRGSPYFSRANVIASVALGVALTAALTGGVHYAVDAVAYIVECTHGAASTHATQFMARESAEVTRNVHQAQRDLAFFVMTVIIAPIVEERVYRGSLQRILGERFGPRRAVAIAASVFGVAHLGIYRVAIYQTFLLGVAFGVAFEEGGLMASMVTHALWNLYLLL